MMTCLALASSAQWTTAPDIPTAAFDGGYSFTLGTKIYVGAGDALFAYDPASSSWQSRADFPGEGTDRRWASAFVIDGIAYVGLGITDGNVFRTDLHAYDPVTDSWSTKASLPGTARGGSAAFVVNGMAYICGGTSTGPTFSDVYRYDPVADAWTLVSALPTGTRGFATAFAIGDHGYVFGGYYGFGNETAELNRYDPASNTWTAMASFPGGGRQSAVGAVVNGKALVGMGHQGFITGFTTFYLYDPASNLWTAAGSFSGGTRVSPVMAAVNNVAYLGSGNDLDTFTPNNDWWSNASLTGVDENSGVPTAMRVFPSPAHDEVTLAIDPTEPGTIAILDITGAVKLTEPIMSGSVSIDLSALSEGIYTALLITTSGTRSTGRIIKQ